MCLYIHKRNVDLIYSAVKPLMKIQFRNIEKFEHLNRILIPWLDGYIAEGEKIIRIQRLGTMFNQNGEVRLWMYVKTVREAHVMMYSSHKIVLMVLIV